MQRSGMFNSMLVDGEYDKPYDAKDFADYFSTFVGNGIFAGEAANLKIRANRTPNMSVIVSSGRAYINGYWYENDEDITLSIPANTSGANQYYAVILALNESQRAITAGIKLLTSMDENPVRENGVYELWLAVITVSPTAAYIQGSDIFDTRGDKSYCGYVELKINHDMQELEEYINEFIDRAEDAYSSWANTLRQLANQLQELVGEDAAGELLIRQNALEERVDVLEKKEVLIVARSLDSGDIISSQGAMFYYPSGCNKTNTFVLSARYASSPYISPPDPNAYFGMCPLTSSPPPPPANDRGMITGIRLGSDNIHVYLRQVQPAPQVNDVITLVLLKVTP